MPFVGFQNPIVVTPAGTTGSQLVDLSAYVPVGATGVELQAILSSAAKVGASHVLAASPKVCTVDIGKTHVYTGVDGNRQCKLYRDSAGVSYKLTGYFHGDIQFPIDYIAKPITGTPGLTFQTISLAGDVPVGTKAVILYSLNASAGGTWYAGVRPVGSSLSYGSFGASRGSFSVISLDSLRQIQLLKNTTITPNMEYYIVATIPDGTWFLTPETHNYSPATMNANVNTNMSDMPVGGAAAILVYVGMNAGGAYAVRKPGSTDTDVGAILGSTTGRLQESVCVGTDSSSPPMTVMRRANAQTLFYLMGYWDGRPSAPVVNVAYVSDNEDTLTFNAVGVTTYNVQRKVGAGAYGTIGSPSIGSYDDVHNLGLDKKIQYQVRGSNEYGAGSYAESIVIYTAGLPPNTPVGAYVSDNDIEVTTSNNAAYPYQHQFQYKQNGVGSSLFATQNSPVVVATFADGIKDSHYEFRARTLAPDGRASAWSSYSSSVFTSLPGVVSPSAVALSSSSTRIQWSPSPDWNQASSITILADDDGDSVFETTIASGISLSTHSYDRVSLNSRSLFHYKVLVLRNGDSSQTSSSSLPGKTMAQALGNFKDNTEAENPIANAPVVVIRESTGGIIGEGVTDSGGNLAVDISDLDWPFTVTVVCEGVGGRNGSVFSGIGVAQRN